MESADTVTAAQTDPFPLTAAQRGLWFAQHLMPDVPITIANYIDVRGDLDHDRMRESARQAAAELGAGSLRLIEIDGEPHQYVETPAGNDSETLDFSGEADPEGAALEWMRGAYSEPIDLVTDPLIKAATLRIDTARTFWYSHVHHLALDGYGAVRLMNRAAEIYTARIEGVEPSPSKAGPLEDVYAAETEYRQSSRFEKDRLYWQDKTRDLPTPISPTGIVAPPAARSRLCGGSLPETLERALARSAQRLDSAFAPIAVSAVAAFLSRLTGADDVVLSLPVAGRTTALLRRSGGMISNVLPIRARIGPDTTIGSLVEAVQLELTGALRHQRYRAEDIRRDAGASKGHRGFFGPAVNIMAYETDVRFGPRTGRFNVLSTGPVEDLSVNIYPPVDSARARIEFEANPNVYTRDVFEDLYQRFIGLLAQFLASDPTFPVLGLDILDAAETATIVPARGSSSPARTLLPEILGLGVQKNPDGVALVEGDRTVTYNELDTASNALARALITRGAGPDSVVAVALPRGVDSVIAFWATAKSGAAFLPIDPTYPDERIAHMVLDSGVLVGLSTLALAGALPDRVHWLGLDDPEFVSEIASRSDAAISDPDRRTKLHPDHAAYVIYTSGSTGTPKGVVVGHRGLAAFTADQRPEMALNVGSRVLRFSSSSFDASVFEMLAAFSAGASMVIAPADVYGGSELTALLVSAGVTHIVTAPALLSTVDVDKIPSLRSVVVGGDICPPDLVDRLRGHADLRNSYGPTETTIVVTMSATQTDPRGISIGTPLQGTSAVVLDRWLRPVPIGMTGELYLGGAGLARGYHRRPALTASRFLADPYGSGARLYRTGDVVRWRGTGAETALEFVGRSDFQVQLNGMRIELGEVDAVLSWHQSADFVVSTVAERDGRAVLVSYVKIKSGYEFDRDSLVALASEFLTAQMIPVHLVELDTVPLTASGKVDRSALPDPFAGANSAGFRSAGFQNAGFRSAAGPIERVIAESMAEVLGRDSVGADDSFFELGGDSIVAIQLVSRAKASGVVFTPRDVFERRTVAGLAEVALLGAKRIVLDELAGGGIGTTALLPIAESVMARTQEPADLDSFYQALVLIAPADVDHDNLLRAVAAVIDHHDMLRARLIGDELDVQPAGTIDAKSLVRFETTDFETTDLETTDVADAVRRAGLRLRPREGVMLQVVHVSGPDGPRLILVAHHLVVDGVSWRILVPDLAAAFSSVALPPVSTSMRRWSHAVAELDTADLDIVQEAAWREVLNGESTQIGSRELDGRDTGATTQVVELSLSREDTDSLLGALATKYRMGPEDALLAALTAALVQWNAVKSHLILVESHGREEESVRGADLSRTVGWFTAAYPVRLSSTPALLTPALLTSALSPADIVKTVKEQLRAVPSAKIGYGALRARGALGDAPSPRISFNYLGRVDTGVPESMQGQPWTPDLSVAADSGSGERLLTVSVLDINAAVSEGTLFARIGFPTGVLERRDVRTLADLWAQNMASLAEHGRDPEAGVLTPSDVPLVSIDQNRLDQWHTRFGGIADVWPLAPLQRGLLFHSELTRGSLDVYTAQIVFELGGRIDAERLHRAASRLLARHDNLRTAFVHDSRGIAVQVVLDVCEVPWREEHTADSAQLNWAQLTDEERLRPFDMAAPPLIRFALLSGPTRSALVVTNHHILFDGWSMPILIKELLVLYAADATIDIPARPYRNYLLWLADRDGGVTRWIDALSGVDEPTLVADAVPVGGALPQDVDVRIDGAALRGIAESLQVTINTVVQTAWSIVLSTVLSRPDVVFGATVSGRPAELAGVTETVGLFINTLPLRVSLDVRDTVRSAATRIQREQVELLDVHHVGLAEITAAVGPGAGFDTLAVFESYPIDHSALDADTDIGGMRVLGIEVADSTHYPLTLVTVLEPTPTMTLRFSPDALSEARVDSIAQRLERVLLAMAERPDAPVVGIDVLGALERRAIVSDWNATTVDLQSTTLVDLLGRVNSSDTCVVFDGRSLTFENFAARVNCLARFLISRDVGPESVVAISMPRSIEQLVVIHAIVHAGAAYLPLDPSLPAARIAYMTETASPVMVFGSRVDSAVPVIDPLTLDLSAYRTSPIADSERRTPLRGHNTAYILFTSGSTGMPKGVAVSHASIGNRLLWMQDTYPLDRTDVVLHKTPTTFDVSVWELFWPHLAGARTVIAEPEGHRDPRYLSSLIRDEGVTTTHFVPSMLDLFLAQGDNTDRGSLRQIFASGEALARSSVQRTQTALDVELHNLYGPTEAAVDVTYHRTEGTDSGPVPIGVPVWNTQVKVLDWALRTVPIGTIGELYLSGDQLARGYVSRPGLTSNRFVADPHQGGRRMYRTGDLVRWTLSGELQYVGRNDFQVKLRGQRLELGEIEAALLRVPGVTSAVATVRGTGDSDRLVAYVCGSATEADIRSGVESELPAYMTPSTYVPLTRLPLSRNGKLDRSALPEPVASATDIVPPSGESEMVVARIFAEVLGIAPAGIAPAGIAPGVGATTSWFELGGNSLTATQVVARINAELGASVGVRDLFDNPSVRGLVGRLTAAAGRPALNRVARPLSIPLAPNQHRMWLLNRFDPSSGAYNIAAAVRLTGTLDADALVESVFDVLDRHEALRTVYPDSPDGPRQVIVDSSVLNSDSLDVRISDTTEQMLTGAIVGIAARGFDVTQRPPVRAAVFRLAPDQHVLLVVTHHIAADGWSMRPLARDVMLAYSARSAGRAPDWAPLPVQYADYSLWMLQSLGSESDPDSLIARQLAFWTEELSGVPELLPLPTDRPRPAVASHRGDTVTFSVPAATRTAVSALARSTGTTQFMIVHTALTVLLAKLSGEREVTVGAPVAGRGDAALDDLVGMFVGTLTLRTSVDPASTFGELLALVRDRDLAAFANADIPFDRVAEDLSPRRSTAHHPLFQVMLSLDDPVPTVELPGLTVSPLPAVGAVAKFDLQLALGTNDLHGTFTYATDLFDASTAEAFAELFVAILSAGVADPTIVVGDLASPNPTVLHGTPALRRRTLPSALSAAVVSSAGGDAVISGTDTLSYPTLDDASTRIARALIARGAGPETSVVIALPRGATQITMLWAVAKTGAACVPVDPTYPAERIEHILTDSKATLGITESIRSGDLDWIHPDELDARSGSAFPITEDELRSPLRPENPAYIIYTSGSTGVPKGVTVTHTGLANLIAELTERLKVDNGSRTLHFASASFDASILELLLTIGAGATMTIAPPETYGGAELTAALRGVTHAFLTPAAAATIDPDSVPDLRVLVVGGEACRPELAAVWADRLSLFNAYGPTEATVATTMTDPLVPGAPIHIGGPIRGVDTYVLDSRLHPVPAGVIGELYLGGDALARGYIGQFTSTATAFVADPFGRGGRLYRTGDRVRSAGGTFSRDLEYHGRADHQVKIRGFRIELGEVDAVLTRHPGVEHAVSVVRADSVVSYVVLASAVDLPEITIHAARSLPAHMVPRAVTIIDRIPMTKAGKTDHGALPEPVFRTREYIAPRTDSEVIVADVFAVVFAVERVGVDDDFFDLGGNSLVATRALARINELAGTNLAVRALFESPTVAGLAAAVDSAESSDLPALRALPRPERIPLSAAQRRMWLLNQADPGSAAYNIGFAVRLSGSLDSAALAKAVRDVVERHESLRTLYPATGDPHQVILPADSVVLDLEPRDLDESAVLGAAADVLGRGFDVTTGVPLRGALFRTSLDQYVLLLAVHHISADGVSMVPLARDVVSAYAARVHGAPAPWDPLPVQYADFALWQHEILGSDTDPSSVASRQLGYWRETLAGLPDVMELPTDRPRAAVASQRGAHVDFVVDTAVLAAARSLAHRHSASVFMVMNAAYAVLLSRLSGSTDIAIGTTVSGRGVGALDDVVGMFVGTLVLRNEVRGGATFGELLDSVRDTNLDALANSDVPFEKVVDAVRPTRSTSHSPLFQALLAYEPPRPKTMELPSLTVSEFPYESGVTRFDLALTLAEDEETLQGSLRYSTDLFDESTAEHFAQRFQRILAAAVRNPTAAVGDIDMLSTAERAALLPVRGERSVEARTLPELIAEAVTRNPDGVAVRWDGEDHTYRNVDEESTRLARVLLGYGVGPETVVAIGLPRSLHSVLAVWAVTKTGAAYVPVDPAYPADRLRHMVGDSGADMGITLGAHRSGLPGCVNWLELDDTEHRAELTRATTDPVSAEELTGPVHLDTAAYMIYTSGSTGLPKGVTVSHRGLANLAESRRRLHRITPTSRFLHNTSPSFDMAVGEIVSALSASATLVVSPPELLGGDELVNFLKAEHVTHTLTTPSLLSSLDPAGLDELEVVCVGGEACGPELVARWAPGRVMLNGYGPTEATDISTLGEVEAGLPLDIGRPIIGFEALVLDSRLHPVPIGSAGELYLAGPALARGYHGRSALTASRFVADPHGGGRMYRTGDIVRWTADAALRYSGRADTQVKIRGFRVELGEIDAVLCARDGIDFAVTLGHTTGSGETVLVSYVLGCSDGLLAHARRALPAYMVPSAVMTLESVPRTPTGKLDIGALPAPEFTSARRHYRPPSTATEQLVIETFSEVLDMKDTGQSKVGVADDFFALGGSSLTAMRVLRTLREATGTSVSLHALLADPTPQSLASLIDSGSESGSSFDIVFPIDTTGSGAPLFCIHPIVGLSWCYGGLKQYTDRPIYGIQTPSAAQLPDSLEALAQRYIDEIEKIAPDGPYHLLGWSLGGTIAHAIAVRLRELGKTVGSLVMLDSHAVQPNDIWDTELPASDLLEAVGITVPGIDGTNIEGQLISLDSLPSLVAGSGVIDRADVEQLLAAARHNHELALRHQPGVYDGDVLYVGAAHEERQGLSTWHPYVRGTISNFSVPQTHWQMTSTTALRAVGPLVEQHIAHAGVAS
ncbi:amino acid adenylation domain-containing protein [Rhodococcus sp. G-MC3]|uniref:non-ribosomal peptide synthetase n=1 Tax=Rhodococcus sp. G-MC3 TaxID=3046209 RepID=UPI0024BA37E6|nr:non-ribosomal peptide synthetase [Rhodococcus sp. G-MC3]MDJ0393600.1 amino acid adenylation domain-containing protein [Rhodococcus sp. G-MC3]